MNKNKSFYNNVSILFQGNVMAQTIPIIISPLIARIYSPENFSNFGVYMSLLTILTVFVTTKFELSIMLPKADKDAFNLFSLSIIISIFTSCLVLFSLINPYINILNFFTIKGSREIFYLLPLSVLIMGIYNSLYYLNNRKKKFKVLAKNKVYRGSSIATNNILFGLIGLTNFGLIASNTLGNIIASAHLYVKNLPFKKIIAFTSLNDILRLAYKYKKFPIFDLPASLFYRMYSEMLVLFFNSFFNPTAAGMYFFASRILKTPAAFFISSFQDVFFQKISEDHSNIGNQIETFSSKILKTITIPFFLIVYSSFFINDIIFGDQWTSLHKYFYYISVPIFIQIINSPFAHVLKVLGKQEYSLLIHFLRFIVLLTTLYLLTSNHFDIFNILIIFSYVDSLFSLISSIFILHILKYKSRLYWKLIIFVSILTIFHIFLENNIL